MEYRGWQPQAAWARTVGVAQAAERLGFESIWLYDHFHTVPAPDRRDRLRALHGALGAGRPDPARAPRPSRHLHGLPQPRADGQDDLHARHHQRRAGGARHRRRLEARGVARLRLSVPLDPRAPGRAGRPPRGHHAACSRAATRSAPRFEGRYARVAGAINRPKPIQRPRVPIMVGGNGPKVTWRLAARYADELNLDGLSPAEVADALPVIRARCEEIGRDPAIAAGLRAHLVRVARREHAGAARVDLLGGLPGARGGPRAVVRGRPRGRAGGGRGSGRRCRGRRRGHGGGGGIGSALPQRAACSRTSQPRVAPGQANQCRTTLPVPSGS